RPGGAPAVATSTSATAATSRMVRTAADATGRLLPVTHRERPCSSLLAVPAGELLQRRPVDLVGRRDRDPTGRRRGERGRARAAFEHRPFAQDRTRPQL